MMTTIHTARGPRRFKDHLADGLRTHHRRIKNTYPYRTGRELLLYSLWFAGRRYLPTKNCLLLTQGRTDSALLIGLLNTHPDMHMDEEILFYKKISPHLHLRARQAAGGRPAYGFSLKPEHLFDVRDMCDASGFVAKLVHQGWVIVYLWRRNSLRQAVSTLVGRQRKLWHVEAGESTRFRAERTEPADLLTELEKVEKDFERERQVLRGLSYLELVYEDDLLDSKAHQRTADRVFKALGLTTVEVRAPYAKTSTRRLSDSISNFDEIVSSLSGTRFEHLLAGCG